MLKVLIEKALYLLPPSLHRRLLRVADRLRRKWWAWRGCELHGCRVLALDCTGQVLLVRHSYGSGAWMLPGGGLGRHESPLEAAKRELFEEVGCLIEAAALIGSLSVSLQDVHNTIHIIAGNVAGNPTPDGREIIAAQFFAPTALPEDASRIAQLCVARLLKK